MNRNYLWAGAGLIILIILIIAGSFLMQSNPTPVPAPVGVITTISPTATVTSLSPSVSIKKPNSQIFEIVPEEVKVLAGTYVKTSSQGRALIEYSTSTRATLDFNSEIALEAYEMSPRLIGLNLLSGQVWSRVEKMTGVGEFYQIKPRTAWP